MRTKNGYTFIEILVVLTIIAILFSLGYANYRGFSRKKLLENAARQVEGDLRLAQSMANAGEVPSSDCVERELDGYVFSISGDTYSIQASCKNTTDDILVSVGKDSISLPSGISSSGDEVEFYSVGRGISGPIAILLTQEGTGNTLNVNVGSGGEISISK